jgi:Ser-tRNA(Ala) deacylase AlaX
MARCAAFLTFTTFSASPSRVHTQYPHSRFYHIKIMRSRNVVSIVNDQEIDLKNMSSSDVEAIKSKGFEDDDDDELKKTNIIVMIKNPRIILCLGILLGVILSIFIHHIDTKPIQNVHKNVKHAYRAHNEARKEYLKRYREAYLESILSSASANVASKEEERNTKDDEIISSTSTADIEESAGIIATSDEKEEKEELLRERNKRDIDLYESMIPESSREKVQATITYKERIEGSKNSCKVSSSEHVIGEWVRADFTLNDTWPCCGWDDGAYRRYPNECGLEPMKKGEMNTYVGNINFYAHSGGHGCAKNCEPTDGNIIPYQWTPAACSLPLFDADHFCKDILGNRSILVIGDSTSEQTASTLMNAVHNYCPERIRFAASDTLVGRSFGKWNRGKPWFEAVNQFVPDIIIANAGAHIGNVEDYKIVLKEVCERFNRDYRNNNKIMIWRTMNAPGDPTVGRLHERSDSESKERLRDWWKYAHSEKCTWRDWQIYPEFDRLAKEYFKSCGIPVLDMEPLYYRTDNHPGEDIHHYIIVHMETVHYA